jgi:MFS family permease
MKSKPDEQGEDTTAHTTKPQARWLTPGVWGIGLASFLSDAGHEVPTSLFASFLVGTLGASAAILGLIEGIADGMAGLARLAGGALADDPVRRRRTAIGGYASTAVLSALIGAATALWQVALFRVAAWFSRGLRVPARNTLLADVVPASVYGRAYGFERAMDNLGAIVGPLLALLLVSLLGVRTAILLSVIPGLLAGIAIGCIETSQHASVASLAPTELRGSAFGFLAAVQSFGNIVASAVAGALWTLFSPTAAFLYLAAWMLISLVVLTGLTIRQGS